MQRRLAIVIGCTALLAACGQSDTPPPPSVIENPVVTVPAPVPVPTPNFVEEERGTYFYVAAVSEEDQRKGKAAGNVLGFRYLGKNGEGQHVLASVSDSGQVIYEANCSEPCAIIKTSDGTRIAYSPSSIIGAAFQDAINGMLKVAGAKAREGRDASASSSMNDGANVGGLEPASESAPWVGRYVGNFEGGVDGILNIAAARNGRVSISLSTGGPNCAGDISGTAKPDGESLALIKPRDDSGNQCRITLSRRGDRIDISEDGCGYFHGVECSFNGQAQRR